MKKFLCLVIAILLAGCDDGDMTVKNFNFGNGAIQSCDDESSFIYTVNGTEAFIVNLPLSSFINVVGTRTATIPQEGFIYRNYSSTVNSSVICSDLPPSTPTVIEEWLSVAGGTLEIETNERRDDVSNELLGYAHTVTFTSLTVAKGDEQIVLDGVLYGTFSTNKGYVFEFEDVEFINECNNNNLVFKLSGSETLILDLVPGNGFNPYPSIDGNIQTIVLNNTDKRILFDVYTSSTGTSTICASVPPITPTIKDRWIAEGSVTISTAFDPVTDTYKHTIIINGLFRNTDNSGEAFNLNEDYLFGVHTTSP